MLTTLKSLIKMVVPKFLFRLAQPIYHGLVAQIASIYFGAPSTKLFVIGVTGTAGKSTTVMMLAKILNTDGKKTGFITTAGSSNGSDNKVNKHGLSMPGGWMLQKQLSEMVANNCNFVIVECTSEGLAQNRHKGIKFQGALFTNLSPAHIDSHGSFENYRNAKGKLFDELTRTPESFIGVNLDDPNKNYFLSFSANKKFGVSMREDLTKPENLETFIAENISVSDKIDFDVTANNESTHISFQMFGTFNVANALLAIGAAKIVGTNFATSAKAFNSLNSIPGRMETIQAKNGATVIVDYAPEPAAMESSLRAVQMLSHKKIIHVFGSTGGHRDVSKRFTFGEISAKFADTIIITNDDVYDSNPEEIAKNIEEGIGLQENAKVTAVHLILDRKEAIKTALEIAEPEDVVLITGKGSEQFLILPGNKRIQWDDRKVVKELL
jgi:UDP-N-acetylmuramoyl-L-alanyl-D-glutamate--2,6-diaminopimelate ligase